MRLTFAYFKTETLQLFRMPFVVVVSVLFPALFFMFFGLPNAGTGTLNATLLMTSFVIYAILGIVILQFGVNIAQDRISTWELFLRVLPASPLTRFAARVLVALLFASMAGALIVVLAATFSAARLGGDQWLPFGLVLICGSIPFALMGIAIGYWMKPRAALPVGNIINFVLAFAGGLWVPPQDLPVFVAKISPYLPTRQYGELAWGIVEKHPWQNSSLFWLLGYTIIFGTLALWGYRRDEGQRYS